MKKTTLVWTFAVCAGALAAQPQEPKKPTPTQEIAKIVAVEEQEGDLAKAEKLYREALAGSTLSAEAKELATLRLAELLVRLGRRDDAKAVMQGLNGGKGAVVSLDDVTNSTSPQDREREATLRAKARELVQKAVADPVRGFLTPPRLYGLEDSIAEQLLWIGTPAVPEVIAYLESVPKANSFHPDTVRGLLAFLWRVGGDQSRAFLRQATAIDTLRRYAAEGAGAYTSDDMLAIAEVYLRLPEPGLAEGMLDYHNFGKRLSIRFAPELLVEVMGQGSVAQRVWLLERCRDGVVAKSPKLFDVARAAMASTEPALGTAAQSLLTSERFRNDPDAIEMVLDAFDSPLLRDRHLTHPNDRVAVSAERARSWLPKLETCVQAAGPHRGGGRNVWIEHLLSIVHEHTDASALPGILRCLDLGYPCGWLLKGRLSKETARDAFARFDRIPTTHRDNFLEPFGEIDLPAEMFADLRTRFDAMVAAEPKIRSSIARMFAQSMVHTGNPDAAAWIVTEWQSSPVNERETPYRSVDALLELGRRSQDEKVRVAMRTLARAIKGDLQSQLYLALLSMHDVDAMTQMTSDSATHGRAGHPYSKEMEKEKIDPLAYVLYDNPVPPHGFTMNELLTFVRSTDSWDKAISGNSVSRYLTQARVPTDLVLALAERSRESWAGGAFTWPSVASERMASEPSVDGPVHRWWAERLRQAPWSLSFDNLSERDAVHFRPHFEGMLASDDADLAKLGFDVMRRHGLPLDLPTLARSKHTQVASTALGMAMDQGELTIPDALSALNAVPDCRGDLARYFGAKVAVDAIPALLQLLQDKEKHVRERAAESLTRIRFFHEQKAHWERIQKGLDASPNSAAEKLLLQAKPGAPKDQRLLAITSLGTLGVPEALPFLIDWTTDPDAAIQKAAKDAITQIHLNPRR